MHISWEFGIRLFYRFERAVFNSVFVLFSSFVSFTRIIRVTRFTISFPLLHIHFHWRNGINNTTTYCSHCIGMNLSAENGESQGNINVFIVFDWQIIFICVWHRKSFGNVVNAKSAPLPIKISRNLNWSTFDTNKERRNQFDFYYRFFNVAHF